MKLSRLLQTAKVPIILVQGSGSEEVTSLAVDSRKIVPGGLFMALPGTKVHGCRFIGDALERGASAILIPQERLESVKSHLPQDIVLLSTPDIRYSAGRLAHAFFNMPSHGLEVIGITGTNGKTTCSYLIEAILAAWGKNTAVSGTICQRIGREEMEAELTTPDCVAFHAFLKKALDRGVEYLVAEVSSHALDQGRVEGCRFSAALFTNLTRDHLDYHKGIESYFNAKAQLFWEDKAQRCVINVDDSYGKRLWQSVSGSKISYGEIPHQADVFPEDIHLGQGGIKAKIHYGEELIEIDSPLLGRHNLQNILASAAVALALGVPSWAVKRGVESIRNIPGRLERVVDAKVTALVDYAHTPDAVSSVLKALSEVRKHGRIITVIGCGGDRDRGKRPEMAATSARLSDLVVFTSDNPRTEDPSTIIDEMLAGIRGNLLSKVRVIEDRKEAIYWACSQARPGDILLVAGKGHEDYQMIGKQKFPFDDREVLKKGLDLALGAGFPKDSPGKGCPVLRNVCRATGGSCHEDFQFVSFSSISTDSRTIGQNALFWAVRGERFDGNSFVAQALERGAAGAVCEKGCFKGTDAPVVMVNNTLYALGEFASWYRRFLGMKTLAITGSCGKTTTKELVHSVLSTAFRTGATMGNYNNLIGLPLTIFSMTPGTEWAVLEMGTNLPGEIERLCQIASPEVGLITCIRPVHLEGLGTIENIAFEKGFVFECLPEKGTAVCNLDDELVVENLKRTKAANIWGFGTDMKRARHVKVGHVVLVKHWIDRPQGLFLTLDVEGTEVEVESRLHGKVNILNIAAAVASGMAFGISTEDVAQGILHCSPPKGRLNMEEVSGWIIVDDTYNANPASMEAALDFVDRLPGSYGKNLVLGDMLELGKDAERYHLELGRKAAQLDPKVLLAVGAMANKIASGAMESGLSSKKIVTFENAMDALSYLMEDKGCFFNGTKRVVLLKGSRGVGLEKVAFAIRNRLVEEA